MTVVIARERTILKRESTRTIHNYFFVKGLDTIKEGGLLAFITSQGVLDSPKNEAIRRYLMQNSRLISAIRCLRVCSPRMRVRM